MKIASFYLFFLIFFICCRKIFYGVYFLIIMEQSAFGIITASVTIVVLLANKISQTNEPKVRYPTTKSSSVQQNQRTNNKLRVVPIDEGTTQARVCK